MTSQSYPCEEINDITHPAPDLLLYQIDQQVPIPICPPTFVPFCPSTQNAEYQNVKFRSACQYALKLNCFNPNQYFPDNQCVSMSTHLVDNLKCP